MLVTEQTLGFFTEETPTLLSLDKESLNQALIRKQIQLGYQEWLKQGTPPTLDDFLPKLVLGLNEKHPKYATYSLIGRKLILTLVRKIFNPDLETPTNHFLILLTEDFEIVGNFCEDLILGLFKDVDEYPTDIVRDLSTHFSDRFVWREQVPNLLKIKARKTMKASKNKIFVVDEDFNTESFRLPRRRLKTFKDFLNTTKDWYRNFTQISIHRQIRSFYFVGVSKEKKLIPNLKQLIKEEKLTHIQTPLVIDFSQDCLIPKKVFQNRLLLDTKDMFNLSRHIFGEAYARVILGKNIPTSSFFGLNNKHIALHQARVLVDDLLVENWNLTKYENPWHDQALCIEI
jgi:hypothetical protein